MRPSVLPCKLHGKTYGEIRVLEAKARLIIPTNKGKTGILYIPADIVKDSSFPFKPNETVQIRIEGDRLLIEKGEEM